MSIQLGSNRCFLSLQTAFVLKNISAKIQLAVYRRANCGVQGDSMNCTPDPVAVYTILLLFRYIFVYINSLLIYYHLFSASLLHLTIIARFLSCFLFGVWFF